MSMRSQLGSGSASRSVANGRAAVWCSAPPSSRYTRPSTPESGAPVRYASSSSWKVASPSPITAASMLRSRMSERFDDVAYGPPTTTRTPGMRRLMSPVSAWTVSISMVSAERPTTSTSVGSRAASCSGVSFSRRMSNSRMSS